MTIFCQKILTPADEKKKIFFFTKRGFSNFGQFFRRVKNE